VEFCGGKNGDCEAYLRRLSEYSDTLANE